MKIRSDEVARIAHDYCNGLPTAEISEKYSRTVESVRQLARRHNWLARPIKGESVEELRLKIKKALYKCGIDENKIAMVILSLLKNPDFRAKALGLKNYFEVVLPSEKNSEIKLNSDNNVVINISTVKVEENKNTLDPKMELPPVN